MNRRALQEALTASLDPHLDDETLAELTTAEAAGEDLEQAYPKETAHLELCVPCAEAYAELLTLMLETFAGMAQAAVSPADVYQAVLLGQFDEASPDLSAAAAQAAAAISRHITVVEDKAQITAALQNISLPAQWDAKIRQAVLRAPAALGLYLTGVADALWQQAFDVHTELTAQWGRIQPQLLPTAAHPVLSGAEAGSTKTLFDISAGSLTVDVQAARTAPLACDLSVRVDSVTLKVKDVEGRVVQLAYAERTRETRTDDTGTARFANVPIAVLGEMTILIAR